MYARIVENPDLSPYDLPLALQVAVGPEGMSALHTYANRRTTRIDRTDLAVYAKLKNLQAEDGAAFADYNLFQHINELSTADMRGFIEDKAELRAAHASGAGTDGTFTAFLGRARSSSRNRLAAAGIETRPNRIAGSEKKGERLARFDRGLERLITEWRDNNKRLPDDAELGEIIDKMLTPIILYREGGWFRTKGMFAFEAPYRKDDQKVRLDMDYEDIPHHTRQMIKEALTVDLKREPTEDEIKYDYLHYVVF